MLRRYHIRPVHHQFYEHLLQRFGSIGVNLFFSDLLDTGVLLLESIGVYTPADSLRLPIHNTMDL